ncbi:MAG: hypothetical protein ACFFFK_04050 [Candidatus Thorarchaeota archaeon]
MMSIELMILTFLTSVILCAVAGDVVKRKGIRIPRVTLVVFHLIYIIGLVASYILL